jgi:hypothetical protein
MMVLVIEKFMILTTNFIIAAVVLVLIIITYCIFTLNVSKYENYIYGFYVADDSFCEDSEVDSMLLFIGEPTYSGFTITRNAYLVIMDGDELICNQGFTMEYSKGWAGPNINKYKIKPLVEFDSDDVFPEKPTMCFDMPRGLLRIYQDDTMYFVGWKQNDVSNVLI